MLTIRGEQVAALNNAQLRKFVDRVLVHLNQFFPTQCKAAGDPQLREAIQYGIERAAKHGITAERDLCKYVGLMVVYGRDFDRDPNLPWVRGILNEETSKDPGVAADRLYEEAAKNSGK